MIYDQPPKLPLPGAVIDVPGIWWRPSESFVRELADYLAGKRVLELFAGNGYLAGLLARRGIQVTATTRFSSHDGHAHGVYYPVEELGAVDAVVTHGETHDVLLMVWPTTTTDAATAAVLWGADKDIVFVGEVTDYSKGFFGGCATDEFFECVEFVRRFDSYLPGNQLEMATICRTRPDLFSTAST